MEITVDSSLSASDLEIALRERTFQLLYQPIFSGDSFKITGVEVLTRLTVKGHSVSPDRFIPLMEEEMLIEDLTSLIFERVGSELSKTILNPFWRIHINISPLQILSDPGRDRLEQDVDAFEKIHRHSLVLEITENRFRIPKNECGKLGLWMDTLMVRTGDLCWYLDDFGRGENFDVLDLPVQGLKIDRGFSTEGSVRPLKAIAQVAKSLGWEIIAEGIETRQDLQRVRNAGVPDFQGYLAWKPLPINKLKEIKD
jgi:EAL domain-containing protein (putative c-di-GMP-specific phosphodiesterase class I)